MSKRKKISKTAGDVTRILYVHGHDFAALEVEQEYENINDAAAKVEAGKSLGEDVEAEIMIFNGKIDPAFVKFLFSSELIDYDAAKSAKFWVLDQEK